MGRWLTIRMGALPLGGVGGGLWGSWRGLPLKFLHSDMAIRFITCLVVVVLMVFLCLPERFGRTQHGVYLITFLAQESDYLFCCSFRFLVELKNRASILRT